MPKTTFGNGTIVEPEFLNSMYFINGGHKHNGGSEDGNASKISLTDAAEVTGILPAANMSKVNLTSGEGVTGILPAGNIGQHNHRLWDINGYSAGPLPAIAVGVNGYSPNGMAVEFLYTGMPLFDNKIMVTFTTPRISSANIESIATTSRININFEFRDNDADYTLGFFSGNMPDWVSHIGLHNGTEWRRVFAEWGFMVSSVIAVRCSIDVSGLSEWLPLSGLIVDIRPTSVQWVAQGA
ncbi:MAG: hypothetical protein FWE57_04290 [Chitinispirillia bacterium]|nr:hypothetical protein [Chitinispirillia bacterium]